MEVIESVKTHQLEETCSYTRPDDQVSEDSFSHRWTIEHFSLMLADTSQYPQYRSALFSSPLNSNIQFKIVFCPNGVEEKTKDYLAIFLELVSSQKNKILVDFSSSFVDSKGDKYGETAIKKPCIYSSKGICSSRGDDKFVLRSDLLDPANGLLTEDRLTILCEVTLLEQSFTVDPAKYRPSTEEMEVLSKKQTLTNLNCVLECDKQTDVTVVFGGADGAKEIRAHKFVLVGASSVFEAMFKYDTIEKQSGVVTLTDVSVEVGELFIQYLYTGKVNQLETYAEELFVVVDKYDIDLLKRMCVQCLCIQMSTSSVCQLLLLSDRHSSTELQQSCIEYITNHATEVIRNEDWQMMSQLNDQLKVDLFRKLVKIYLYLNVCLVPRAPQISEMEATESVNNHQLEETSSNTRFFKHSFSHRWTIEDFSLMLKDTSSKYPHFKSAPFSSPVNSAIQFTIDLYPKNKCEDYEDYLSLHLNLELASPYENEILVHRSVYLVNSKGEKYGETVGSRLRMFSSKKPTWGWPEFLLRSDLLNPANDVLNEDRLTIHCEVTVFDGAITSTLDPAKYRSSTEEVKVHSRKQTLMNLISLLECDKQTDVTVVFEGADGAKEIRAHKFVLVGASSVFEEMFKYDTSDKQSGVVTLTDVSVEAGELFVKYLYTGKVNQLETYAEELFVVADMYGTDLLKRMCVQCLCSQMSTSSVCQLLLLSDRHSSTELQLTCIEYITNHANEVIRTDQWPMMSQLSDQLKVELFRKLVKIFSYFNDCIVSSAPQFSEMETTESLNNHELEKTSSNTRPVMHSFSHRWTIEAFSLMLEDTSSDYPHFKSAPFSSPVNSAIQFTIDLYPNGCSKDSIGVYRYLSIFLKLISPQKNEILVNRSFYLVDSKGKKYGATVTLKPSIYSSENSSWGDYKFFLQSDLLHPANDLLSEDRLIIICEVTLLEQPFTVDTAKYRPSTEEVKVFSKKKTLMNLNCVLECDKQTDVTVVVGNGAKEIRAHKFVLVGASSVFEAMFKYDTCENQSGIVTLTDVSVEVGELFIRYLYTGKVNQLETYAEELFDVADMFDIDLLKRMCVQCLCSQMNTSSVCQLLLLSDRHSSTELQQSCIEYITNHANEVIRNEDWQLMSQLNDQLKVELFRKLVKIYSDFTDCIVSSAPQISEMETTESVNNHQLEKTSSNTRFVKHSFTHRWTIEDFSLMLADTSSDYPQFKSAPFSSPINSSIQFTIDLRPKGYNENFKDYLSIFLTLASSPKNEISLNRSFYLIDSKGDKYGQTAFKKPVIYTPKNSPLGWTMFLLRSDLLDPANDLLNGDKLMIVCEVTVFQCPLTVDTCKYRPSTEGVKVLSKKQTLMNLNCVLECGKQTDVTLVVGNGANSKEVRVHKFVLVGASSVFEAMFKCDTIEKHSGVVSMSDVSVEAGELFIRYLYTGKMNELEAYAEELFVVADKYGTDLVKRMCVQSLCSQISTDSVFKLLLFADRHSSTELQQSCIEYITNHATDLIRTDHWQMISQLDDQLKVHLFHKLAYKH